MDKCVIRMKRLSYQPPTTVMAQEYPGGSTEIFMGMSSNQGLFHAAKSASLRAHRPLGLFLVFFKS